MANALLVGAKEVERYLLSKGVTAPPSSDPSRWTGLDAFLVARKVNSSGWLQDRRLIAVQQLMFKDAGANPGVIDGLTGPQTMYALEQWQNLVRDTDVPKKVAKAAGKMIWPRERDLVKFYGKAGTGLVMMDLPYPMKIAWDLDKEVHRIQIHGKCAESAHRVLEKVHAHYGKKEIDRLGFNLFGGCIANPPRFKRGSTKSPSTHNWAIALDFDPVRNQLRWGRDRARLALASCVKFWEFWEEEGWVSLGRERNYDWMHIQAANL